MSLTLETASNTSTLKVQGVSMLVMNANTGAVSLTSEIASPGALDLITYTQAQQAAQQSLSFTDVITLTGTSVEVTVPSWAKDISIHFNNWKSTAVTGYSQRIVKQKKVGALTYSTVSGTVALDYSYTERSDTAGIAVTRSTDAYYGYSTTGILSLQRFSGVTNDYTWVYGGSSSSSVSGPYLAITHYAGRSTATESLPNLVFTTSNGVETMTGTACISYRG